MRNRVITSEEPSEGGVNIGRDRDAARLTLGKGLAVSAFPLYVPV